MTQTGTPTDLTPSSALARRLTGRAPRPAPDAVTSAPRLPPTRTATDLGYRSTSSWAPFQLSFNSPGGLSPAVCLVLLLRTLPEARSLSFLSSCGSTTNHAGLLHLTLNSSLWQPPAPGRPLTPSVLRPLSLIMPSLTSLSPNSSPHVSHRRDSSAVHPVCGQSPRHCPRPFLFLIPLQPSGLQPHPFSPFPWPGCRSGILLRS